MKHKRFEENILIDEAYTNSGRIDKNADQKKGQGIAKHFAETLDYEERKKWYQQLPEEPSTVTKVPTQEQLEQARKEASSALHGDTLAYETKSNRSGSSDQQWARTLLNKGAIGDRVAAATILIQDNPLYNLTALRNLVNSVKPAKKKDGIVVIDALSELFISELLIPDAKLRSLEQHPTGHLDDMTSGNKQARRNILKLWFYEDQLKELYGTYVEALNKFAHDSVDANKEKAVSAMSYLLMHHPEREKMLLTNIINKLGDPSQAVASKVIYHLCQLLYNHPNMKSVVLGEIEKMLFRTNISSRAQYYGVCFLNQFFLGKDDSKIAENLIRIYFSFFKASIKKGEIDSRLMSAILTGVKRAYPFAEVSRVSGAQAHVDAVHKLVHLAGRGVAVHALALLAHVSAAGGASDSWVARVSGAQAHVDAVHKLVHLAGRGVAVHALALLAHVSAGGGASDRYYTALYRKLSDVDIFSTTHSAMLFSLIYKSLKQDKNIERVTAFVKRLLQLCCYMTPAQACGMLFLISQVLKDSDKKEAIKLVWTKREIKEEEIKEETEETADKEQSDTEENGVEEYVNEEEKAEQKKIDLLRGDKKDLLMDDDEEESYVDLKIDEDGTIKPKRRVAPAAPAGWFHARVGASARSDKEEKGEKELDTKIQLKRTANMDKVIASYDPWARNPSFAGASRSAHVELRALAQHFHPTVRLFAQKLLGEQLIQYSGDPLKDFAGIRFLDRFVFKNPKKRDQQDGDVKKVKGSHPKFAVRKNYTAKGIKSLPVNSASYLNEDAKKIPVDEKFLYDFLQKRREVKDDDEDESDNDSVTSEDFEKYLDSVTGTKAQAESDEELDYLAEMEATKQQKKAKKKKDGADDDLDELGEDDEDEVDEAVDAGASDEGDSDGELNISGDEDEPVLSGDEDELMLQGSDDEDDEIEVPGKKAKGKLKLKGKDDLGSLFASAEEFSTLLEETASNKKQGSSQAVSNMDNSSKKQLAWEEKRDRWIKGFNNKILGNKKGGKNRKFSKNKQNGGFNKMADGKKGGKRKGGNVDNAGGKRKKFK